MERCAEVGNLGADGTGQVGAKPRTLKTDGGPLPLRPNLDAGHAGR
jgi:hypothetical protein